MGGGALATFVEEPAAAAAAAAAALCAALFRMRVRRRYTQSPGFLSHLLQGVWPLHLTFLRRQGSHAFGFFSMPPAAAAACRPAGGLGPRWTSGAAEARASHTVTAQRRCDSGFVSEAPAWDLRLSRRRELMVPAELAEQS